MYVSILGVFGRMGTPRSLGEPRAGNPANSPAGAISQRRGSKGPRRFFISRARTLRAAVLLLVLALHAVLLLLATHWQTRLQLRSVDSLLLQALPSHAPVGETGVEPILSHERLELPLEI